MTDSVAVLPWAFAILDSNGDPVSGGTIEFYNAGGLVARTVYSDHSLSTSLGAIVTLSSAGVPINGSSTPVIIYTGTTDYKVIIKNSSGSTLYTYDNIDGAIDTSSFGGSTSNFQTPVETQATDHTVTTDDIGDLYQIDPSGGNRTFTLDSAVDFTDGRRIGVRHNGTANNVLIATVSSEQINLPGGTTTSGYVLTGLGHTVWLISNGTSWVIDLETPPFITGNAKTFTVTDRLSTPPGSPAAESTYIITGSPTGAWSARSEHDIAKADGQGGWIFATPPTDCGWLAYVQDEDEYYAFKASAWVAQAGFATLTDVAYEYIGEVVASTSTSVNFTDLSSTYFAYDIVFHAVLPATNGDTLFVRVSDDNGSTFKNGANDYRWAIWGMLNSAANVSGDTGDSEIELSLSAGSGSGEYADGTLRIINPSAATKTKVHWDIEHVNTSGDTRMYKGSGVYDTEVAIDAIQFLFSTGNIASGTFKIYGLRAV